jgi:hypothetical protein
MDLVEKYLREARFNEKENEKIFNKYQNEIYNTMTSQAGDWDVIARDKDGYHLWTMDITFNPKGDYNNELTVRTIGEYHPENGDIPTFVAFTKRRLRELKDTYKMNKK